MHEMRLGSLQRSPDPLAGLRGLTSKGRGYRIPLACFYGDGKEREREGKMTVARSPFEKILDKALNASGETNLISVIIIMFA